MEPASEREQAIRSTIYEWARTTDERRALGQWAIAQADTLDALNGPVYTSREEYRRCGKARCTCATGPGNGPYVYRYWTAGGKTRREYVSKPPVPTSTSDDRGVMRALTPLPTPPA